MIVFNNCITPPPLQCLPEPVRPVRAQSEKLKIHHQNAWSCISKSDKEELGFFHSDNHDDYYKLCAYMNEKAYENGAMTLTGNDTPIYYLNGQTEPYDFWVLRQDDFIEYDNYGEPIYSGVYFGRLGDKQHFRHVVRENMPTEIWEGVLTISKSIKPSGPQHMVYKDGKFMK